VNFLLTGASGQLGQELLPRLAALGEVTPVDREVADGDSRTLRQDLGDLNRVEIVLNRLRPDIIVNAAAYTAVDRAEEDSETAFHVNADLPGCLARWAQRNDRLLVHYSTDYVFSGEASEPYREDAPTGPLNVYGESKLAGEWAIAAAGCRHLLLRTSWVYSGHGHNFVLTMLRLARERPALSIVADQTGCPTWARNLAQATAQMLLRTLGPGADEPKSGTWHYCDNGVVSWYDFARKIFEIAFALGLLKQLPETRTVTSAEFRQLAERPRYSVLDTAAIRAEFGIEPPTLEASLRACLGALKDSLPASADKRT
jgi:dTDP-4-dehydrorhamnose reductase